ncbi:MAG: sugar ABC transporter permease [Deltaproteobacteria bacterium]|jgi:multiple sugar transport system permease protein|nr:sugar ABC transporter permease [Deltaproteobacteria bacterium]
MSEDGGKAGNRIGDGDFSRPRRFGGAKTQSRIEAVQFMSLSLIILAVCIAGPMLYSFVASFFSANLRNPGLGEFVGLDNYVNSFKSPYFRASMGVTALFTVLVVVLEFIVGFAIALLLNRKVRGKNIFFSIIIIPMLISPIAVGLTWRLLLHPKLGIVNYALGLLGLPARAWLGSAKYALGTVIFVDIWQQVPYMVLVLMAGLVSLPSEPYEAASIDGASRWQTFFRLTLPMMLPNILVALLLRTINALKTYDLIYVLTKGGPGTSTEMISYHIYKRAFTYLDIGSASAMSYLLMAIVMPLSYVFFKLSKNKMN